VLFPNPVIPAKLSIELIANACATRLCEISATVLAAAWLDGLVGAACTKTLDRCEDGNAIRSNTAAYD